MWRVAGGDLGDAEVWAVAEQLGGAEGVAGLDLRATDHPQRGEGKDKERGGKEGRKKRR